MRKSTPLLLLLLGIRFIRKARPTMVFLFGGLYEAIEKSIGLFRQTVWFKLYSWYFKITRKVIKSHVPAGSRVVNAVSSRWLVHAALFFIGFVLSFPYTSLAERTPNELPGRNTLLYAIVGPGDQNFIEEDETVTQQSTSQDTESMWREGAVFSQYVGGNDAGKLQVFEDVHQLAVDGTALVKPLFTSIRETAPVLINATTPKQRGVQQYVIQSGDSLGTIAYKFGISINTILWANNLTVRSIIKPGQTLTILPTDGVLYIVKKGDTIGKIAKQYAVPESEIISGNSLGSGAIISVGKQLVIPGGRAIAVAPSYSQPRSAVVTGERRTVVPTYSSVSPGAGGYVWPSDARIVTQYYGLRHNGLDIAGKVGTKIYAAQAGTVTKSQCGWNGGYGCYLVIDHGNGFSTLYGHNSALLFGVGDTVSQGQNIALMGSTGNSTGPHVHFEVRKNLVRINPLQYVR